MKKNNKGLSDVVATVLIVLLALAAIAIVWAFISPAIRSTGTAADLRSKCLTLEVEPLGCTYPSAGGPVFQPGTANVAVSYKLKKGNPSDFSGIAGVVELSTGVRSSAVSESLPSSTLSSGVVTVPVTTAGASIVRARVAAVVQDESDNTATCEVSIKTVSCNPITSTAICGNDVLESGELCDDGNTISEPVSDCLYGEQSCAPDCNEDCDLFITRTPNFCGDGNLDSSDGELCDDGNILSGDGCSNTCQNEVPIVCGDGIVNGAEECDPGVGSPLSGCSGGVGVSGGGLVGACASSGPNACICP